MIQKIKDNWLLLILVVLLITVTITCWNREAASHFKYKASIDSINKEKDSLRAVILLLDGKIDSLNTQRTKYSLLYEEQKSKYYYMINHLDEYEEAYKKITGTRNFNIAEADSFWTNRHATDTPTSIPLYRR